MRLFTALFACAALAAVASTHAASAPSSEAVSGRALFLRNGCEQCHGTVGQGNRSAGPKLAPHPLAYDAFLAQLRRPRAEMPPYSAKLVSDADAAKIRAFLASVPDGKSPAAIPMLADVATGMPRGAAAGGALAGRTVFAQHCAACHGSGGAGGTGPALIGERGKKDLAATIAFVKHPQGAMPALYPSPLTDRDVANVAAYVQSL